MVKLISRHHKRGRDCNYIVYVKTFLNGVFELNSKYKTTYCKYEYIVAICGSSTCCSFSVHCRELLGDNLSSKRSGWTRYVRGSTWRPHLNSVLRKGHTLPRRPLRWLVSIRLCLRAKRVHSTILTRTFALWTSCGTNVWWAHWKDSCGERHRAPSACGRCASGTARRPAAGGRGGGAGGEKLGERADARERARHGRRACGRLAVGELGDTHRDVRVARVVQREPAATATTLMIDQSAVNGRPAQRSSPVADSAARAPESKARVPEEALGVHVVEFAGKRALALAPLVPDGGRRIARERHVVRVCVHVKRVRTEYVCGARHRAPPTANQLKHVIIYCNQKSLSSTTRVRTRTGSRDELHERHVVIWKADDAPDRLHSAQSNSLVEYHHLRDTSITLPR